MSALCAAYKSYAIIWILTIFLEQIYNCGSKSSNFFATTVINLLQKKLFDELFNSHCQAVMQHETGDKFS